MRDPYDQLFLDLALKQEVVALQIINPQGPHAKGGQRPTHLPTTDSLLGGRFTARLSMALLGVPVNAVSSWVFLMRSCDLVMHL